MLKNRDPERVAWLPQWHMAQVSWFMEECSRYQWGMFSQPWWANWCPTRWTLSAVFDQDNSNYCKNSEMLIPGTRALCGRRIVRFSFLSIARRVSQSSHRLLQGKMCQAKGFSYDLGSWESSWSNFGWVAADLAPWQVKLWVALNFIFPS